MTPKTVTPAVTVDTADICTLAAKVGAGRATAEDLQLAERLLLALVAVLPPDGAIGLLDSPCSETNHCVAPATD